MTIFTFKIHYSDSIFDDVQERYVLAETEEEAQEKLDEYRKRMIADGFADFVVLGYPTVELENVIV